MNEGELFVRLVARLRSSGAFRYDEWMDDADGSYSIEGVAHTVMDLLRETGVLAVDSTSTATGWCGGDRLCVLPRGHAGRCVRAEDSLCGVEFDSMRGLVPCTRPAGHDRFHRAPMTVDSQSSGGKA